MKAKISEKDPLEKELSEWFAKEVDKAKADPQKYIKQYLGEPFSDVRDSATHNITVED